MRKLFTIGIFALCLLISISAYSGPTLQDSQEHLLDQRIELHMADATLMHVLSTLSVTHRVPIGFEGSAADQNEPKLVLESANGSLKEILDSIVKQEPLYRWEVVDGVINFVPVNDRDPFIETLLSTSVSNYDPGKWTIKFQLRDAIGNTPEVKKLLESNKKTFAKYQDYVSYPSIYTKEDVDLRISNTTVRGILNRIVRISEHKSWSISWTDKEKNALSIRL